MQWFYLVLAGGFEVVWATFMKMSHGFSRLGFTLATLAGMVLSFWFLALAVKHLPLLGISGLTGIGAVGSIIVGVVLFKDQLQPATWFFIALLVIGIIGIKVTSGD